MRLVASLVLTAALSAAVFDSQAVWRKLEFIERGHPPAGSRVLFTPAEINAWIADEARARAPRGARNLRLELGASRATGYGDIDFVQLHQAATGAAPNWFMKNLLAGQRPVKVSAVFHSEKGRGRVDVERVEISGVAIEGPALDFLIENFVRPMFPYAIVAEWFPLQHGVDRITVNPTGVAVTMTR